MAAGDINIPAESTPDPRLAPDAIARQKFIKAQSAPAPSRPPAKRQSVAKRMLTGYRAIVGSR